MRKLVYIYKYMADDIKYVTSLIDKLVESNEGLLQVDKDKFVRTVLFDKRIDTIMARFCKLTNFDLIKEEEGEDENDQ